MGQENIVGQAASWSLQETIRALRPVARQQFCDALIGLQSRRQDSDLFDARVFSLLAAIGRNRNIRDVPERLKVFGLLPSCGFREVYFGLTRTHFVHAAERTDDGREVLLLDIVFPTHPMWGELLLLLDAVRTARERAKAVSIK